MENQRNLILAAVLSILLFFGWEAFSSWYFPAPKPAPEATQAAPAPGSSESADDKTLRHSRTNREGGLHNAADIALEQKDLSSDLSAANRVKIASPDLSGSINPVGARIDDLTLNKFSADIKKGSGPVRLFSPTGTPAQYFAQFGWLANDKLATPSDAVWQTSGGPLAPGKPVTLTRSDEAGLTYTIKLSVDDHYLITAEQTVANHGTGAVVVKPFALVSRTSKTASGDSWNIHSGPIGEFGGAVKFNNNYEDVDTAGDNGVTPDGRPGWIGFTDIYWLSALVADKGEAADANFHADGGEIYRANLIYHPVTLAAGKQYTRTTRLFAGAKESSVLKAYEDTGITNFSNAIDWGWFGIIEKPILWLLKSLFKLVGNFGIAIMLLTVLVRGIMFPVAQRQFASMAAMRAVQPKMKALQERYKDDKPKLQSEMAALYKSEGVNPLAGCLPLVLQIPIFFALYKVLTLAIDMRHQPFALWIKDLSAPDPLHILNLFGYLDFTPTSFFAIGPLAVLLGFTMFLQFKLNPAQMDPVQQQMFMFMPWILMFVMAPFAAGLLIYWCTSNLLTIAQQAYLYSRHPQLKVQAEKTKADSDRAKARDKT